MPGFDPALLRFILLSIAAVFYVPVIVIAILRRAGQEWTALGVGLFGLIGLGLEGFEIIWRFGQLPQYDAFAYGDIQVYGALALAFLTLILLSLFLRRSLLLLAGLAAGLVFAAGLYFLLNSLPSFPAVILSIGSWTLTRDRLPAAWAALGWLVFILSALIVAFAAYRKTDQPHLRNRLIYWMPVILFLLVNDGLILAGEAIPGNPLRWAAALLLAYVSLTHYLLDLRLLLRRILIFALAAVVILGLYLISYDVIQWLFSAQPAYNHLLVGIFIALVLAFLFSPMLALIRRMVEALLRLDRYDASRTLPEYSRSISNILDMERLASIAVGTIQEGLQARHGTLFLVDQNRDPQGNLQTYHLRAVRDSDEPALAAIDLSGSGLIAARLSQEVHPLLQYDLDLLPAFRNAAPAERTAFKRLECEVYVPVFSKKQWIGLLAFGPKGSGNRYTDSDLALLSAMASQTGVALENARLVEDLQRLNADLQKARRELEQTYRDLQKLDQTKADFISIASHELRTPLTVIRGYSEMILEDTRLEPNLRQSLQGIHAGILRLHEIMDSMFDIAQIDTRTFQLNKQAVNLGELLCEVCTDQSTAVHTRNLSLTIDLPELPRPHVDLESMRKVFHHLVNNAIKFTPNEGRITITGREAAPDPDGLPDGGVEIVVSDTGVGVDPDFREIIFTKFYQPGELTRHSTSHKRFKGSGSGLGLALSKGILEMHGGRIWVESPGHDEVHCPGSSFHVLIPLSHSESDISLKRAPAIQTSY